MFKEDGQDGEAKNVFPFPLFTTALHQLVQFSLAALIIYLFPQFRPRHDSLDPHHGPTEPPPHPVDSNKPLITKWFYFSRIGPCGVATGFDIGLGNMSLRFISLTFFSKIQRAALLQTVKEADSIKLCVNPPPSASSFFLLSFSA